MKLKNIFVGLTIGLLLCTANGVSPDGYAVYASSTVDYTEKPGIEMRAEQTEWRFRLVDGKLQQRLWSITYEKWLTDWEWA